MVPCHTKNCQEQACVRCCWKRIYPITAKGPQSMPRISPPSLSRLVLQSDIFQRYHDSTTWELLAEYFRQFLVTCSHHTSHLQLGLALGCLVPTALRVGYFRHRFCRRQDQVEVPPCRVYCSCGCIAVSLVMVGWALVTRVGKNPTEVPR